VQETFKNRFQNVFTLPILDTFCKKTALKDLILSWSQRLWPMGVPGTYRCYKYQKINLY